MPCFSLHFFTFSRTCFLHCQNKETFENTKFVVLSFIADLHFTGYKMDNGRPEKFSRES